MTRRSLLGAAGGALLLTACGAEPATTRRPGVSAEDIALLNDILAFEHVEAAFHRQAALGELAAQEATHVATLTRGIRDAGGRPVASDRRRLRLPERDAVPTLARRIEELRAAALLEQLPRIANAGLLAVALSIHAVEARHVIALRDREGSAPAPTEALAEPVEPGAALERVRTWLA